MSHYVLKLFSCNLPVVNVPAARKDGVPPLWGKMGFLLCGDVKILGVTFAGVEQAGRPSWLPVNA